MKIGGKLNLFARLTDAKNTVNQQNNEINSIFSRDNLIDKKINTIPEITNKCINTPVTITKSRF